MKLTKNLQLPVYDDPVNDMFDLMLWNEANESIDSAYEEIKNTSSEITDSFNSTTSNIVNTFNSTTRQTIDSFNETTTEITNNFNKSVSKVEDIFEEIPKVNASAEVIDARGGEATLGNKVRKISSQLDDITTIQNGFYAKPKNGKKIVFVGDSTTDVATEMYPRLNELANVGGILEGATFVNRGSSGNTVNRFINNLAYNENTITKVLQDQANLYVFCYGINDIRAGADSPARTKEQIRADIKIAIDRLLNETNGYILLRTPNIFLTKEFAQFVDNTANCQKYTDILWEIYESFRGYHNRVDVLDVQSIIFGRKAVYQHQYMKDTLHPNDMGYRLIGEVIAEHISHKTRKDYSDLDIASIGVIKSFSATQVELSINNKLELEVGDYILIGENIKLNITERPHLQSRLYNNVSCCNTYIINHNLDLSKYGVCRLVKANKKYFDKSNWKNVQLVNVGQTQGQIEIVVDLQGYNGLNDIAFETEYFTSETVNLSDIQAFFFFNDSPNYNNVAGGVNKGGVSTKLFINENNKYATYINFDKGTYRYLHILVMLSSPNINTSNIRFRNSYVVVNKTPISLLDNVFKGRNVQSSKTTNVSDNDVFSASSSYVDNIISSKIASLGSPKWVEYFQNKSASGVAMCVATYIDITGFTGQQEIKLRYKYKTNDNRITHVYGQLVANTNDTSLSGGVGTGYDTQLVVLNEYSSYIGSVKLDLTNQTRLHLVVNVSQTSGNGINFNFGEVEFFVGNTQINANNLTWSNYLHDTGSTISEGYKKDSMVSYEVLLKELAKYQKLP